MRFSNIKLDPNLAFDFRPKISGCPGHDLFAPQLDKDERLAAHQFGYVELASTSPTVREGSRCGIASRFRDIVSPVRETASRVRGIASRLRDSAGRLRDLAGRLRETVTWLRETVTWLRETVT